MMAKNKHKTTDKQIMGRKLIPIDFETVAKLCAIQCTGEEIASVIGVDYDTLERRIKTEFNLTFTEYYAIKRGAGKASLRRMQWKAAESGNTAMLIWLGKQHLDQKERQEVDNKMDVKVLEIAPQIVEPKPRK